MANNELRVTLLGDASKLNATLKTASGRLKSFGKSTQAVGRSLQTRLALPLAVAGGAAIKMAGDFDKSMTKIKTLVGIASDEVDEMGVGVKAMAKEFAISSADAADALFFVTSAGLRGKDAMEALEGAMKASAIGMGEAKTIAQLTSAAMNAYGSDTLNASDATDVLTAAIREGSIESDELASVMGQVLPVASNMGIAFDQVGAAFAAMSRTGTPAAQAATQLNSIMMGIMKPTQSAADAMELMGLSSEGLRQQIKDEGLLSVLNTLKEGANQNAKAFEDAFGNVRALRGILDLTGKSMETTRGIFGRMTDTTGITQTAVDALAQSAEFRLRKAMNSAKESFAQVGATLLTGFLPIFEDVSRVIQNVFNAFFNLDQGTQKLVLALGAFAVVLPTIITLVGTLTTIIGALLTPIGLVAGALAGVAYIIYTNWAGFRKVLVSIINYFIDLYNESMGFRVIVEGIKTSFKIMGTIVLGVIKGLVNAFKLWFQGLYKQFSSLGRIIKGVFTLDKDEILAGVTDLGTAISDSYTSQFDNLKSTFEDIGSGIGENIQDGFQKVIEKGKIAQVTEEQIQEGVDSIGKKFKGFLTGFIGDVGGGGGKSGVSTLKPKGRSVGTTDGMDEFNKFASGLPIDEKQTKKDTQSLRDALNLLKEDLDEFYAMTQAVGAEVGNAFNGMAQSMISSLGLAESGIQGFLGSMLSMIGEIISMLLANAVANAIAGATGGALGTGAAAPFTLPMFITTMVGGVMAAFAAIPKFADGGIVSGTTLGVMGEYTGAKQNPEVIAPLNKLEGMIGAKQPQQVNVGGEFRIQGQDLVVALQRAERNRSRLK